MVVDSKEISKNILATIAYYDVFSYPLTIFEIWKYLMRSDYFEEGYSGGTDLSQIAKELKQEPLIRFIEEDNGFYFLKGRKELVAERIKNSKISFLKLKRLRFAIKILRFVPFVKMIGVTGRLAMKNAQNKSDWDVFIVLKKNRIWIGRTIVTLVAHLIGKRRHGKKIQNRICLNYFATEEGLEIPIKDLYSANEYFFLYPIFGFETFKKFQLKNKWIKNMKPHYYICEIEPSGIVEDSFFSRNFRKLGEKFFNFQFLENWLEKIEKKKIMKNPKTYQEGGMIRATNEALIFLPELKGPKVFDKFKEKIENLA